MIERADVVNYHRSVMQCSPKNEYFMIHKDGSQWFAYANSLKEACLIAEKIEKEQKTP